MTSIPRPFQNTIRLSHWQPIFHLHRTESGSGTHPASYPMGNGSSCPRRKAARVWSSPVTSI